MRGPCQKPCCRAVVAALLMLCSLPPRAAEPVVEIDAEDAAAPWSQADGSGAANAIVQAAFARGGRAVHLHVVPYARCKAEMLAGVVVGCIAVGADENLGTQVRLPHTPLYRVRTVLVSREDGVLDGCDADRWPATASVGRVNGYEYTARFEQAIAHARLKPAALVSEVGGLRMLAAGRVDAVALQLDALKSLDYLRQQAGVSLPLRIACDFGPLDSHIGFSLRHPDGARALAAFETGYAAMRADGSVERILDGWRKR